MRSTAFECTREGLTIRGYVWQGAKEKGPVVILSHGFMANQSTCKTYAMEFAALGCTAVTFDFCGGGLMSKSDGKSEAMSLATEVLDLEAVLAWVRQQPFTDTEKIVLLGCSQGGFVSALVARTHPEIRGLFLLYPALCIPDDARAGKMLGFSFDPAHMPEMLSSFPMKIGRVYAQTVMDWDWREKIRGYEGKTVLLHGTEDSIVAVRYAREAKAIYPQCSYYELEGAGHGFGGKHDRQAIDLMSRELKEMGL